MWNISTTRQSGDPTLPGPADQLLGRLHFDHLNHTTRPETPRLPVRPQPTWGNLHGEHPATAQAGDPTIPSPADQPTGGPSRGTSSHGTSRRPDAPQSGRPALGNASLRSSRPRHKAGDPEAPGPADQPPFVDVSRGTSSHGTSRRPDAPPSDRPALWTFTSIISTSPQAGDPTPPVRPTNPVGVHIDRLNHGTSRRPDVPPSGRQPTGGPSRGTSSHGTSRRPDAPQSGRPAHWGDLHVEHPATAQAGEPTPPVRPTNPVDVHFDHLNLATSRRPDAPQSGRQPTGGPSRGTSSHGTSRRPDAPQSGRPALGNASLRSSQPRHKARDSEAPGPADHPPYGRFTWSLQLGQAGDPTLPDPADQPSGTLHVGHLNLATRPETPRLPVRPSSHFGDLHVEPPTRTSRRPDAPRSGRPALHVDHLNLATRPETPRLPIRPTSPLMDVSRGASNSDKPETRGSRSGRPALGNASRRSSQPRHKAGDPEAPRPADHPPYGRFTWNIQPRGKSENGGSRPADHPLGDVHVGTSQPRHKAGDPTLPVRLTIPLWGAFTWNIQPRTSRRPDDPQSGRPALGNASRRSSRPRHKARDPRLPSGRPAPRNVHVGTSQPRHKARDPRLPSGRPAPRNVHVGTS
jgi:hypothetical protein